MASANGHCELDPKEVVPHIWRLAFNVLQNEKSIATLVIIVISSYDKARQIGHFLPLSTTDIAGVALMQASSNS